MKIVSCIREIICFLEIGFRSPICGVIEKFNFYSNKYKVRDWNRRTFIHSFGYYSTQIKCRLWF